MLMRNLVLTPILWLAGIGAVGVAGLAMAGSNPDTAKAATTAAGTGTIIDYATSYTSPSNTSIPVHLLKPGQEVDTYCFRDGQVLDDNPYWFAIHTDGQTAYVHRSSISVPQGLQHC
jgi:hypothetical protein